MILLSSSLTQTHTHTHTVAVCAVKLLCQFSAGINPEKYMILPDILKWSTEIKLVKKKKADRQKAGGEEESKKKRYRDRCMQRFTKRNMVFFIGKKTARFMRYESGLKTWDSSRLVRTHFKAIVRSYGVQVKVGLEGFPQTHYIKLNKEGKCWGVEPFDPQDTFQRVFLEWVMGFVWRDFTQTNVNWELL